MRRNRAIVGVLLLVALVVAWNRPFGPGPVVSRWLFPQDVTLFVLETRADGDFAKDLERVYPPFRQRRDGMRVVVHQVDPDQVLRSSAELFDRFGQTQGALGAQAAQGAGAPDKLFIELAAPYSCSKKTLRQEIDLQQRFEGIDRRFLLRATVPIVGARASAPDDTCTPGGRPGAPARDACDDLTDDWVYMADNFGGLGLKVDAQTMDRVGQCLPRLFVELFGPAAP